MKVFLASLVAFVVTLNIVFFCGTGKWHNSNEVAIVTAKELCQGNFDVKKIGEKVYDLLKG